MPISYELPRTAGASIGFAATMECRISHLLEALAEEGN